MNPRKLNMKKRCCVIFGGPKLVVVLKSKNREEKSFQSELFLKKLISRGSPEVTFCSWTKFQRAYGRSTFFEEKKHKKNSISRRNVILPPAHGQLEKTNLGWSDLAFGMSSGASAVYGWIRLGELVPTNELSRPHPLWHAGIFKKH